MKLITLNTWGGRIGIDIVLEFFRKHSDVDIFCLQEIWNGGEHMREEFAAGHSLSNIDARLLSKIKKVLPDHAGYFRPNYFDWYGIAIFIKKSIPVLEEGEVSIYKERGYISDVEVADHARNLQHIVCETRAGIRRICNLHGLWNGRGKGDSAERLKQSDAIVEFLKANQNPLILCGDFNLSLNTESIAKLERSGLRNLVKEYRITSTRTTLYNKPERFADYIFVSPGIDVLDFQVLPDEISDHSPLYLEFT